MTAGGGQEHVQLWGWAVFLGEKMAPVYGFGMRRGHRQDKASQAKRKHRGRRIGEKQSASIGWSSGKLVVIS